MQSPVQEPEKDTPTPVQEVDVPATVEDEHPVETVTECVTEPEPEPANEPEVASSLTSSNGEPSSGSSTTSITVAVDTTCCSPWLSCAQYKSAKENPATDKTSEPIDNVPTTDPLNDTVHGQPTSTEFEWQTEFFKKFEWLKESIEAEEVDALDAEGLAKSTDTVVSPKSKKQLLYAKACAILEEFLEAQAAKATPSSPVDLDHPEFSKLYLYFVALEDNRMILHASFKRNNEQILQDCVTLYEFARVYAPTKIVYVLDDIDFYDVDKYVKMFMNLFGIDETRGGAYTDVVLPDYMIQTLERELKIATVEHFVEQERRLSKVE